MAGGGLLEDDVDVLICSPKESFWSTVKNLLTDYNPLRKTYVNNVEKLLETQDLEKIFESEHGSEAIFNPLLAIVDAQENTQTTSEWVQSLKMSYPHVPVMVLYNSETPIDLNAVLKNGADSCYHFPFELEFFREQLLSNLDVDDEDAPPLPFSLVPIKLNELRPGTIIPFSLYLKLPSSEKILCIRKKNNRVDQKTIDKFSQSKEETAFVRRSELNAFFKYAREFSETSTVDEDYSLTEYFIEKKAKLRSLFNYFLDSGEPNFDQGRLVLNEIQNFAQSYGIHSKMENQEIKSLFTNFSGHNSSVFHDALATSVFTGLFAKICRFPENEIQSALIAGLLHNIGLSELSPHGNFDSQLNLSYQNTRAYRSYGSLGLNLIKSRKVSIPLDIGKAIEQCEERIDGSGYPFGHENGKLSKLSKVLQIAIEFNRMVQHSDQHKALLPEESVKKIFDSNNENKEFDSKTLNLIYFFFAKNFEMSAADDFLNKLVG